MQVKQAVNLPDKAECDYPSHMEYFVKASIDFPATTKPTKHIEPMHAFMRVYAC